MIAVDRCWKLHEAIPFNISLKSIREVEGSLISTGENCCKHQYSTELARVISPCSKNVHWLYIYKKFISIMDKKCQSCLGIKNFQYASQKTAEIWWVVTRVIAYLVPCLNQFLTHLCPLTWKKSIPLTNR